jgi:hypothetical protein
MKNYAKQQAMNASSTKETCNSILVRNSLNVLLRIPKAFSTTPMTSFVLFVVQQFQNNVMNLFFEWGHDPCN